MAQQKTAQKIAFFFAIIFYLAALGCLGAVIYFGRELGSDDPIVASLAASVVFFIGGGIVLHVIGRVNLPSLRIPRDTPQERDDRPQD